MQPFKQTVVLTGSGNLHTNHTNLKRKRRANSNRQVGRDHNLYKDTSHHKQHGPLMSSVSSDSFCKREHRSQNNCGNLLSVIVGYRQPLLNPYGIPEPYRQHYKSLDNDTIDHATNSLFCASENKLWPTESDIPTKTQISKYSQVTRINSFGEAVHVLKIAAKRSIKRSQEPSKHKNAIIDVYLPST